MRKCKICRFFDIFISLSLLLLGSPLSVLIIVLLKFTGEGEVFFLQPRIGQNGKIIYIIKFATMLKNSENIGTGTVTLKDDVRILPVGKFLRRTKINETPQLLNILIGNMSFVGPRPQTDRCFSAFPQIYQEVILSVKPGLTGIGSIIFSDEEELLSLSSHADALYDNEIMPYKGRLESWFIERNGAVMYFTLIFLTAWKLIFKSNRQVYRLFPQMPKPNSKLSGKLLK
jgi:lipopolysaccharide/colanic/teichoic acid biosynthesis glycosyltransferase